MVFSVFLSLDQNLMKPEKRSYINNKFQHMFIITSHKNQKYKQLEKKSFYSVISFQKYLIVPIWAFSENAQKNFTASACNFVIKGTLVLVFFCEFCEINTFFQFFTVHLFESASDPNKTQVAVKKCEKVLL